MNTTNDEIVSSPDNTSNIHPTDPDEAWRETLAPALQPVALRHGREMFLACFNVGLAHEGLANLMHGTQRAVMTLQGANARRAAGEVQQELSQAIQVVASALNWFSISYLSGKNWDNTLVAECTKDIQLALILSAPPVSSTGKILLPH